MLTVAFVILMATAGTADLPAIQEGCILQPELPTPERLDPEEEWIADFRCVDPDPDPFCDPLKDWENIARIHSCPSNPTWNTWRNKDPWDDHWHNLWCECPDHT